VSYGQPSRPNRITVVRHGATEWSTLGRHTGKTDLPLVAEGETEAVALRGSLSHLRPALVLSSPLRRARDTCGLAGFGDKAETTELLTEMDYGEYEGLTTGEIRRRRPDWDLYRDGCPGGERIEDVAARVDAVIDRLTGDADLDGCEVLVFAHGHVLRCFAARWIRLSPPEARHFVLASGSLGALGWEHEWPALTLWNTR
jgi:broad specificity phosphatase PhoE